MGASEDAAGVLLPELQDVIPKAATAKIPRPTLKLLRPENFFETFMMILRVLKAEGFRFASRPAKRFPPCGGGLSGILRSRRKPGLEKTRKFFGNERR